jgi:hypothetical protein
MTPTEHTQDASREAVELDKRGLEAAAAVLLGSVNAPEQEIYRAAREAIRAYLSHSPAPVTGVKVRELAALAWQEEWNEDDVCALTCIPVRYDIFHQAVDVNELGFQLCDNSGILGFHPSIEAAKAAAQADYARRDLTTLHPVPAPDEELVRALEWYASLPHEWTVKSGNLDYGTLHLLGEKARTALANRRART